MALWLRIGSKFVQNYQVERANKNAARFFFCAMQNGSRRWVYCLARAPAEARQGRSYAAS